MESGKEPLSFGRYLQAVRLEKKISLEQISQQTRIGLANLLHIEQEDHDGLPAEVYVKGFLRAYAKVVGADGDEVIRRYESRLEAEQKLSGSEFSSKMIAPGTRWKLFVALVLLICIIALSISAVVFFRQVPEINSTETPLKEEIVSEKEQTAETQPEQESLQTSFKSAKAVPEKLLLHVTAIEDTWLKLIMDEKAPTEYNLKSGNQIELEANTGFSLLIGNAGGLIILLNDKPVPIPGKSGEVVTIELP
jgi:cytoskeleton protein RodZ